LKKREEKKALSLVVPAKTKKKLQSFAKKEGESLSEVIRVIIETFLKETKR
jgi:predicted DNA-binding protein